MCWLGRGDILVIDGQCQDEFRHSTDPGREQERINVTFRWIKQHVFSCPLFKAGVACCLPTCAQGSSVHVVENFGNGVFWAFRLLLGALCILGVLALLVTSLCASCLPEGGGRWRHYLCYPWGVCWAPQKTACQNVVWISNFHGFKLYMPALVRWLSLHCCDAYMVYWVQGVWKIAGKNKVRPLFLLKRFFCLVEILFSGTVLGFDSLVFVDREGQTSLSWPSLSPCY